MSLGYFQATSSSSLLTLPLASHSEFCNSGEMMCSHWSYLFPCAVSLCTTDEWGHLGLVFSSPPPWLSTLNLSSISLQAEVHDFIFFMAAQYSAVDTCYNFLPFGWFLTTVHYVLQRNVGMYTYFQMNILVFDCWERWRSGIAVPSRSPFLIWEISLLFSAEAELNDNPNSSARGFRFHHISANTGHSNF